MILSPHHKAARFAFLPLLLNYILPFFSIIRILITNIMDNLLLLILDQHVSNKALYIGYV
jgi:hypothetical protein